MPMGWKAKNRGKLKRIFDQNLSILLFVLHKSEQRTMDINHIHLQYDRLARHHQAAMKTKDPISFLDLAHALRIW